MNEPTPPPWPPSQYPSTPPTTDPATPPPFGQPLPQPAAPQPPTRRPVGVFIGLGAAVLGIVIALVALAFGDDDSVRTTDRRNDAAIAAGATPTTVTVNDVASQPVEIDGESLPYGEGGGVTTTDESIGMTVPTIIGSSFDGSEVRIEAGEATVVVVMAHWCPHCQAEIPRIVDAFEQGALPIGVRVVGVATANDEARGNFPPSKWLDDERWPFAVLVDTEDGDVLEALGVSGFPSMVAIAADGTVAARSSGELSPESLVELWDAALGAVAN